MLEAFAIRIEDFRPELQGSVRALVLAGLKEHWETLDDSLNSDLHDIQTSHGDGRTVVAFDGTDLVATGTILPRDPITAEIVRMSVSTKSRRCGIGRMIVDELVETARLWGCTSVVAETKSAWKDAVQFYESCGFIQAYAVTSPHGDEVWLNRTL